MSSNNLTQPTNSQDQTRPAAGTGNQVDVPRQNGSSVAIPMPTAPPEQSTVSVSPPPPTRKGRRNKTTVPIQDDTGKHVNWDQAASADDEAPLEGSPSDEEPAAAGGSEAKAKGNRKKKQKVYVRPRATPVVHSGLCCCDLQTGVFFASGLDCFLAFVAAVICGSHVAQYGKDCAKYGVGFSVVFFLIGIFLIFGAYNRNSVLCSIYMILSWCAFAGLIVVVFAVPCYQKNWLLITGIVIGALYKIYATAVILTFMKEPPPKGVQYVAQAPASTTVVPTYVYDDPVIIPVGARGYGYPYRPYYGGYYNYGYDPGMAMVAGLGMGYALGGGFHDHCYDYDACYW